MSFNIKQLKILHLRYGDKTRDRTFLLYVTDSNYFFYVFQYWLFHILIDYILVKTHVFTDSSYFLFDVILISE